MKKSKSKAKLRPLGDITDQMEPLLRELGIQHKMQRHEILGIIDSYLTAHLPSTTELYTDGTKSVLYVGHGDGLK